MSAIETQKFISGNLNLDIVTLKSNHSLAPLEKCLIAIESVIEGRSVIFEGGLKSSEEFMLIRESMKRVDHETFFGVEIHNPRKNRQSRSFFRKSQPSQTFTIVSPIDYSINVNFM